MRTVYLLLLFSYTAAAQLIQPLVEYPSPPKELVNIRQMGMVQNQLYVLGTSGKLIKHNGEQKIFKVQVLK